MDLYLMYNNALIRIFCQHFWFSVIALRPNSCILHKLIYPLKKGDPFTLKEVRRYQHKEYVLIYFQFFKSCSVSEKQLQPFFCRDSNRYQSNSWLIKITSNGRYILAPT